MTREEAMEYLEIERTDYDMAVYNDSPMREALNMAIEALAKMEIIQRVIDMPLLWERDDRRRYAKVVDIVRKDLSQEVKQ